MSTVSIIIPTLNEASSLGRTLRHLSLLNPPAKEILVVDAKSTDETVSIALSYGVPVVSSPQRGRAIQMNLGAKIATGDFLCFLHGDTIVPDDLVKIITKTLADETVAAGGFISIMAGAEKTRWALSIQNYIKTYYTALIFYPHLFVKGLRILFGDQVIFCRSSAFCNCGGFDANLPIMEDADLCIKLVRQGRIYLVNRVVESSDRRVAKWGELKANFLYSFIFFLWMFGVKASYIKRFYKDIR